MKDRIKSLRKALDLTQQQFAEKLGLKRNSVASYEIGRNVPMDAVIISICREFNVNEEWLRTGKGVMFVERSEEEEIADLVYELMNPKDDDFYIGVLELIRTYQELSPSSQKIIKETAAKFMNNLKKRKGNSVDHSCPAASRM